MNSHCNNLHEQASCWCVPAEYVRPRFFYGQRLGVVDFDEWLWYHAGKQRFHNLTSHGVGVLCGLRAELYPPGESATTRLTITRGAAYDACGREVIVPVKQCVDVAQWFRENRDSLPEGWGEPGNSRLLCIGLRYRECPSDPAPAPRDPCGCDAGGCEYARVREGFQLRLFPATELPDTTTVTTCQSYHDLLQVLGAGVRTPDNECDALQHILHGLAPPECPPPGGEGWLWLACFDVTLEDDQVTQMGAPNNAIPQRLELLSISALQEMLLGIARDAGLDSAGPRLTGIAIDDGVLQLGVALYEANPLTSWTIDPDFFHLRRFDTDDGTWSDVTVTLVESDEESNLMELSLEDDDRIAGMYRLTVISPPETPIADTAMRPLLPLTYACNFQLEQDDSGTLSLNTLFG